MATSSNSYTVTKATADAFVARYGTSYDGYQMARESDTTLVLSASGNGHSKFANAIWSFRPTAPVAETVRAGCEPATGQQIAYLRRLIADDYGTATTIGARITPDLTKQAASRFISMLRNGV